VPTSPTPNTRVLLRIPKTLTLVLQSQARRLGRAGTQNSNARAHCATR
jgi:hypothetical protein